VFLNGNECTVYDARPDSCQKFPHVVRGNGSIASRMWELIDRVRDLRGGRVASSE